MMTIHHESSPGSSPGDVERHAGRKLNTGNPCGRIQRHQLNIELSALKDGGVVTCLHTEALLMLMNTFVMCTRGWEANVMAPSTVGQW